MLLAWSFGLAFESAQLSSDEFSASGNRAIESALSRYTPPLRTPGTWNLTTSTGSDDIEHCDYPKQWTWGSTAPWTVELVRVVCHSPSAAFDILDNYAGSYVDVELPAATGNYSRIYHEDARAQIVWRERSSMLALNVTCAPQFTSCLRAATTIARELDQVAPPVSRRDDQTAAPSAVLAAPVGAWLLFVAPLRIVQRLRRPTWVSADGPRYRDLSRELRNDKSRVRRLRVAKAVAYIFTTVAAIGVLGFALGPQLNSLATAVVAAGGAFAGFRYLRGRRPKKSAVEALSSRASPKALFGIVLTAWSSTLAVAAVTLFLVTAIMTVALGTLPLDRVLISVSEASESSRPSAVPRWMIGYLVLGNRNDISMTLVLATIPALLFAYGLRSVGGRLRAADARQVLGQDRRPPILYLRSFDEDKLKIAAPSLRRGSVERLLPLRKRSFERVLESALRQYGPLIAVSDPRTRIPRRGAARFTLPHDAWYSHVEQMSADALVVVISGTPAQVRPGLTDELAMLGDDLTARIMVIQAPYRKEDLQRRWAGFLERSCPLPLFAPLAGTWIFEGTHVIAHSAARGWAAWGASTRTDRSYALAIDAAFRDRMPEWLAAWNGRAAAGGPR